MITRDIVRAEDARPIKSFVSRSGRISTMQDLAMQELWPQFGLSLSKGLLDWSKEFGNTGPVVLEIGFGDGRSLIEQARSNPGTNFVGVEVYRPGIAKLMSAIKLHGLSNIRVYCADAFDVLELAVVDGSLHGLQLFFPDPWPKVRHKKRRIVQQQFVDLVATKVSKGGYIHMATDWEEYAWQMLEVMGESAGWSNVASDGGFVPRPESRMMTKFEQRGLGLGHGVWDIVFRRI